MLVSPRPESQTASKTKNGQTPRLSPKKKRRTSYPLLPERPSVSVSASRSKFLTLTNASSRLPSSVEDVEVVVDSVAAEAVVVILLPVVAEANSADVVKAVDEVDVAMVLLELHVVVEVLLEGATLPRPSTPTTRALSPVWANKASLSAKSLRMILKVVRILYDKPLRTNDLSKKLLRAHWG